MNDQERHNRAVMLRRVRAVWLVGVLEESLHGGRIAHEVSRAAISPAAVYDCLLYTSRCV